MFKPLAVVLGAALSLGAGQLAAQRFEIVKPAEGVTDDEIKALVKYMRSFKK